MSLEIINFEILFRYLGHGYSQTQGFIICHDFISYITTLYLHFSICLSIFIWILFVLCQYYHSLFILLFLYNIVFLYILLYDISLYKNISINYSIYSIYFKSTIYWLDTICILGLLKEKPASRRAACATSELGFSFSVTSLCFYSYTVIRYIIYKWYRMSIQTKECAYTVIISFTVNYMYI